MPTQRFILSFQKKLMQWHESITPRYMPWKLEQSAYHIWLSEIILQQTRYIYGLPYYEQFASTFPTIHDLANASLDEVIHLWQGLGYYSRARNLHKTAILVSQSYHGQFPNDYKSLCSLPGIGNYTANAILSFAFQQPYAVLDGNVYRVLSRIVGDKSPVDTHGKHYQELANQFLEQKKPGAYNQAIMDFGATVCLPKGPKCTVCHLKSICVANQENQVAELPIKAKRIKIKKRKFIMIVHRLNDTLFIKKRTKKDVWESLYEYSTYEVHSFAAGIRHLIKEYPDIKSSLLSKTFNQKLTHQNIQAKFYTVAKIANPKEYTAVGLNQISQFPFPKIINEFNDLLQAQ